MKKILFLFLLIFFAFCPIFSQIKKAKLALDLTKMPQQMIYSAVFNMLIEPERYEGKEIRINGRFGVFDNPTNPSGEKIYACIVPDAMACCEQGLEFALPKGALYPRDYPAVDSLITIKGVFHHYVEDGYDVYKLIDTVVEKVQ